MDAAVKLIEAIAKLLGAIAWPAAIAVIAIYVLRRHRDAVGGVFDRAKSVVLPGGAQIDLYEKVRQAHGEQVAELADRLPEASGEEKEVVVEQMVKATVRKREIGRLLKIMSDRRQPRSRRQSALDKLNEAGELFNMGHDRVFRTVEEVDAVGNLWMWRPA